MSLAENLHRAIRMEQIETVKELVKAGADLNKVLGMRGTALCAAIESRNVEIADLLLRAGCDVNIPDYDGEPTLLLALRKDLPGQILGRKPCLDIVCLLIDHPKTNLNLIDPLTRKSAIHFASEQGMADVVHCLLQSGRCDVNSTDANGNTALHLALSEGLVDVVNELVTYPDCWIKVYNRAGLTPLHIASGNGDVHSMKILVKRLKTSCHSEQWLLADPNFKSELNINVNVVSYFEKETCLHIAARHGYLEIVKMLLENSAAVNVTDNLGNTALILSIVTERQWMNKSNDIIKLMLKHGANPNAKCAVRSRYVERGLEVTPLTLAAMNNNIDLAKTLVQHGADVNLCDGHGRSPLYVALWSESIQVAEYLLQQCNDLNVNIKTVNDCSCLHAVFKCSFKADSDQMKQLVKELIDKGALLEPDKDGKSPIDYAFDYENALVLDVLLDASKQNDGANGVGLQHTACVEKEESLIGRAVDEGLIEIVHVLLYHGANIDERNKNNQSLLYIALLVEEYGIARYLVENGCDLTSESYLKEEYSSSQTGINYLRGNHGDDESLDSDDEENDICENDTESVDLFQGDIELQQWMREQTETPTSLMLTCLVYVRKYFRTNAIPFRDIDKLPLPSKLRNHLRYRK